MVGKMVVLLDHHLVEMKDDYLDRYLELMMGKLMDLYLVSMMVEKRAVWMEHHLVQLKDDCLDQYLELVMG